MNILQMFSGLIPEVPELIVSDHKALIRYAEMAEELGLVDMENDLGFTKDELCTANDNELNELVNLVEKRAERHKNDLKWWVVDSNLDDTCENCGEPYLNPNI